MKMNSKLFGGIKIFKSAVFQDSRGSFREVYKKKFIKKNFMFDCLSISKKNVLRGLHIQTKNSQAKFLTVVKGEIFDVAVDLRKKSKTFGKYFSINLSSKNYSSIYIPKGFAHGFCCLDKENIVYYCNSNYRNKNNETGILWNDPDINIKWPIKNPILSIKDKKNFSLKEYSNNF
jgi:dTDP-4-dehydrorhamnose 3,5-epimerase